MCLYCINNIFATNCEYMLISSCFAFIMKVIVLRLMNLTIYNFFSLNLTILYCASYMFINIGFSRRILRFLIHFHGLCFLFLIVTIISLRILNLYIIYILIEFFTMLRSTDSWEKKCGFR